jgi:hypothetical protein
MGERKAALVAILGVLLLVLILCLVFMLAGKGNNRIVEDDAPARPVIPPEEYFLPGEPDFTPPVFLERERRQSWTAEDAAPFWRNPLEKGEEPWRERIESVIDQMLEGVP